MEEKQKTSLLLDLRQATSTICKGGVSDEYKLKLLQQQNATAVMVNAANGKIFGGAICSLKGTHSMNDTMFIETICSLGGGLILTLVLHAYYRVAYNVRKLQLHSLTTPLGFYALKLRYKYRATPQEDPVYSGQIEGLLRRIDREIIKSEDPAVQELYNMSTGNDQALVQHFPLYRELTVALQPVSIRYASHPCNQELNLSDLNGISEYVKEGCTTDGYYGFREADDAPAEEEAIVAQFRGVVPIVAQFRGALNSNVPSKAKETKDKNRRNRRSMLLNQYGGTRRRRRSSRRRRS